MFNSVATRGRNAQPRKEGEGGRSPKKIVKSSQVAKKKKWGGRSLYSKPTKRVSRVQG